MQFVQHLRQFQDSLLSSSENGKFVNPGTACHTKSQKELFVSPRMISNLVYLIVYVLCSTYIQFSPRLAHIIVLLKVNFPSRCSLRKSVLPQPRKSYLTVCSDLLIWAFRTLSPWVENISGDLFQHSIFLSKKELWLSNKLAWKIKLKWAKFKFIRASFNRQLILCL